MSTLGSSLDNPDVMAWALGEAYRMGLRGESKTTWTGAKLARHLRPLMTTRGFQRTALRHAFAAGAEMFQVRIQTVLRANEERANTNQTNQGV